MGAAPPQESKASGPPALIAGGTVAVLFLSAAANSRVKPGGIIIYGAGITISEPNTPLQALGPLLSQSISP
jgi:hypothetical protein